MDFEEFENLVSRGGNRDFFKPMAVQVREYATKYFGEGDPPIGERLRKLFLAVEADLGFYVDIPHDTPATSAADALRSRVNEWARGRGNYMNALALYYWFNFYSDDLSFADRINAEIRDEEIQKRLQKSRIVAASPERPQEDGDATPEHLEKLRIWEDIENEHGIKHASVREIDAEYLLQSRWTLSELLERVPNESSQYANIVLNAARSAVRAYERTQEARKIRQEVLANFREDYEHYIDLAKRYREVDFEFGEPTMVPFGQVSGREIGLAVFRGGDHWIGEISNNSPNGIGAWKIFSVFVDTPPDGSDQINEWSGAFSFAEAREAVYRFANGSVFLGEWRSNTPQFGLMVNPTSSVYSMFLGPMGAKGMLYGQPAWGPSGLGVASLFGNFLAFAEIQHDRVVDPMNARTIEDRMTAAESARSKRGFETILSDAKNEHAKYTSEDVERILRNVGIEPKS